jgi:hypothetical protein
MDRVRRKTRKSRRIQTRRTNRGRFAAVWLAVFALALRGLIPLAQGIPGPRRADGLPSRLVLCTALAAKAGPSEGDRTPTDKDRRACPVCQIAAIGKVFLPVLAEIPTPRPVGTADWERRPADFSLGSSPRSWRARAPPKAV